MPSQVIEPAPLRYGGKNRCDCGGWFCADVGLAGWMACNRCGCAKQMRIVSPLKEEDINRARMPWSKARRWLGIEEDG